MPRIPSDKSLAPILTGVPAIQPVVVVNTGQVTGFPVGSVVEVLASFSLDLLAPMRPLRVEIVAVVEGDTFVLPW